MNFYQQLPRFVQKKKVEKVGLAHVAAIVAAMMMMLMMMVIFPTMVCINDCVVLVVLVVVVAAVLSGSLSVHVEMNVLLPDEKFDEVALELSFPTESVCGESSEEVTLVVRRRDIDLLCLIA